jgi:hypothetical protein
MNYDFGPLQVSVESLGQATPWPGKPRWSYHVTVRDAHGNFFEAGWYLDKDDPALAARRVIALLWTAVNESDFLREFHGGYSGEERSWRQREAYRLHEAGKKFKDRELTKASAKAIRKMNYEQERGPRDWSPIQEIPLE